MVCMDNMYLLLFVSLTLSQLCWSKDVVRIDSSHQVQYWNKNAKITVVVPTSKITPAHSSRENRTIECKSYHHKAKESNICQYVTNLSACQFDDGYIQYIRFPFCCFDHKYYVAACVVMFLWMVYLFIALGVTAEDFFCPCLKSISKTLHMSDSVAGVTLLALGNGAPDIFSVIAAVDNVDDNATAMAFQELFGAGIFVTTVVAGFIHISASFKLARRPFTRDVLFYCAAVGWTITVMYKKDISTAEAIGFIVLYFLYALIVIIGQFVNRRIRHRAASTRRLLTVGGEEDLDDAHPNIRHIIEDLTESADFTSYNYSSDHAHLYKENINAPSRSMQYVHINEDMGDSAEIEIEMMTTSLLERLIGIRYIDWKSQSYLSRAYSVTKAPIIFVMSVTSPVVDRDVQGEKWNKWLVCLQCLISPLFSAFAINKAFVPIYKEFVIWHLLIIIGVIFMVVLYFLTSTNTTPKFHSIFAFLGFVVSILWIKAIAQEIVNLLQTFGWMFGLSYGIMGLTFLAWGNSIGDFISNLTMARHGAPRMAIAACYGGPLLNMLLGVGISCLISAISNDGHKKLIRGSTQYILSALFLGVSLLSVLIIMPLLKFNSTKYVGYFLLFLYLSYIVMSVLHETDILHV